MFYNLQIILLYNNWRTSSNIWLFRNIVHAHTENLLLNSGDPIALCRNVSISVSKTGLELGLGGWGGFPAGTLGKGVGGFFSGSFV